MQAVILAGGKGTRLRPLTTSAPKPMVPLFDRPVMEYCVKLLAGHGITDIIVAVSHLAQEIMHYFGDGSRYGVKIRYSVEMEALGTAGAVKLVQGMINGTFLVVAGDIITDFDLAAALQRHKAASAIASLMLYRVDDPSDFGLVESDDAGRITRFLEKPKSTEIFTDTISTGIYILEPEALSCIPYDRPCDFARELFPRMLNNREPVYGFRVPGYWCDVGNLLQYRNAHFDALEGRVKLDLPATHVGGGVWLGEGVKVHPSVNLASPVFLGSGVTIRRSANIGERTVIGANTLVDEFASISNTIIGSGSFVGPNARITGCVIGSGCATTDGESIEYRTLVSHAPSEPKVSQQEAQTLSTAAQQTSETEKTAA